MTCRDDRYNIINRKPQKKSQKSENSPKITPKRAKKAKIEAEMLSKNV